MDLIPRSGYLKKLEAFRDKSLIKVITGVRHCGKTMLMTLFKEKLRKTGVPADAIVTIDFEDFESLALTDPEALHGYLKSKLISKKAVYFFLDEIQLVKNCSQVLASLSHLKDADFYLASSSPQFLSSENATLLAGRYIEIKMWPLSFSEFVGAQKKERPLAENFRHYLEKSAFPYAQGLAGVSDVDTYLEGSFYTSLFKDVMQKSQGIADAALLEAVARALFDNIGSLVSIKKITDMLVGQRRKVDVKTVEKYVAALIESNILCKAKRYDIQHKEKLARLEKYYLVDLGLRRVLLGNRAMDIGHALENVIYLELLRRGFEVYVGKVADAEVDFVVKNEKGLQYIQVAATVRDEATLTRELRPLQKISDSYPKMILTLDEDPTADFDGICRMNALQWLIETT